MHTLFNLFYPFIIFMLPLQFPAQCRAIVNSKELHLPISRVLTQIDTFGYEKGGTLTFETNLSTDSYNLTLFLCTDKEFGGISSLDSEKLCSSIITSTSNYNNSSYNINNSNPSYCEINGAPINIPINRYTIESTNLYHLLLLKCAPLQVELEVDYILLNPGNQQLSLGYIPLPKVYISLSVIWFVFILLSTMDWIRNKSHVVIFHSLLGAVCLLKFGVVAVALGYWELFQSNGYGVIQLQYLQSFLFAVSETAFFCALLLIAKGWRITRTTLPPSEIRTISVALVLLLSTLLFFSLYNEGYYFLSLMIMYFFMLPKIFTSITRNTRALQTKMLLARYANIELSTESIIAKMKMFKTLRTAVILYLGSILMISSMKIIMLWYLLWVNNCVSEIIALVMVMVVSFLLRPRENGAFSTRAFLEENPFPFLNVQNMDHFDEFFGEHILDPELILMNAGLRDNLFGASDIDIDSTIVVEYPSPPILSSTGKIEHYPRLALGTMEKHTPPVDPPPSTNSAENSTNGSCTNNNINHLNILQAESAARSTTTTSSLPLTSTILNPGGVELSPQSIHMDIDV